MLATTLVLGRRERMSLTGVKRRSPSSAIAASAAADSASPSRFAVALKERSRERRAEHQAKGLSERRVSLEMFDLCRDSAFREPGDSDARTRGFGVGARSAAVRCPMRGGGSVRAPARHPALASPIWARRSSESEPYARWPPSMRWTRFPRTRTSRSEAARSIKNRRRPTLPGPCEPSTIGAEGLNFSVRNGKRCFPLAKATGNLAVTTHLRAVVTEPASAGP